MDERTKLKRMLCELVDTQSDTIGVEFTLHSNEDLCVTLIDKKTKHSVWKVICNYDSFYTGLEQMKDDLLYFCSKL